MPDREKVKAELDEIVEQCRGMDYIGFSTITEHCQNILALPKELEAVVRCKDCKYHGNINPDYCLNLEQNTNDDFYCAYGERKEGR